jgi:hypothetical protein
VRAGRSCIHREDSKNEYAIAEWQSWSGRVLQPELLETASSALAEKNLRDMARINRWFGTHRALLRLMKDLASPQEQFSLLDVGAGSGDMGKCKGLRFCALLVVSAPFSRQPRDQAGRRIAANCPSRTDRTGPGAPLAGPLLSSNNQTSFQVEPTNGSRWPGFGCRSVPARRTSCSGAGRGRGLHGRPKTQPVVPHLRRCLGLLSGRSGTQPSPRKNGQFRC